MPEYKIFDYKSVFFLLESKLFGNESVFFFSNAMQKFFVRLFKKQDTLFQNMLSFVRVYSA